MKRKELYFGILIISMCSIACSRRTASSTVGKKKDDDNRNVFYPTRITVFGDSIVGIAFFQTAVPYFLNMKEPKSKKNLKIITKAHRDRAMVYVKVDQTIPYGKIIGIELASAYYTEAFRRSLHTGPIKP